jgi:hypothetical protein
VVITGPAAENSALYFPWVLVADPHKSCRARRLPPSGFVAGIYARTDMEHGVWKAPAGPGANLKGVTALAQDVSNQQREQINDMGINCPARTTRWLFGCLHLRGDRLQNLNEVCAVRRWPDYRGKLNRGLKWWSSSLMAKRLTDPLLERCTDCSEMAFAGQTPQESYFVDDEERQLSPTSTGKCRYRGRLCAA